MTHAPETELSRLREQAGKEGELLSSAADDAPAARRRATAMQRVLDEHRRRRSFRLRASVAGALALAAAATLLIYRRTPTPLLAEPQPRPSGASKLIATALLPREAPSIDPLARCAPAVVAAGAEPLIDDFEDGDMRSQLLERRAGHWLAFNDGTGTQVPRPGVLFPADRIPSGRDGSRFGLHSHGGKFSKWGATISLNLSPRLCYDASVYAGIEFWARGRGRLRFGVQMTQVVSEEFGGSCVRDCFDSHVTEVTLSKTWQRYQVRWEELAQRGFGQTLPFDPRSLSGLEFSVGTDQTPYDFWLDDVGFLSR